MGTRGTNRSISLGLKRSLMKRVQNLEITFSQAWLVKVIYTQ